MLKLHKRPASALCGIFAAAALLSVQSSVYGDELALGFPMDFNFRSLIRATDSEETLEFCAFCGPTRSGSAYIISFNVPGVLSIEDNNVFYDSLTCLPTDVYSDGQGVTDPLTVYQIYQSPLVDNSIGFLSVYLAQDFNNEYYSRLGNTKMAPLSSVSSGDKVYIATFDSPYEVITDYGYVDSVQSSDKTFIVNTNEQWVQNNYITWVGAPIINQKGEVIGVLMPIDQGDTSKALVYALDDVIDYLEDECGFSIYGGENNSSGGGNANDNNDNKDSGGSVTDKNDNKDGGDSGNDKNDNKDSDKNDQKDENDEDKSTPDVFVVAIVLLVIGAAVAGFFIFKKKRESDVVPPPQNYGLPMQSPANLPPNYGQQIPENQPQAYGQQMPENQPQIQQPTPPAPPENPQNFQIFNSQDSPDIGQAPVTTFIQTNPILKCVDGTLNGSSYPIADTLCIGRNPALCNIIYPQGEPGVSGMHCKITMVNGQVQLTDTGSSAGTFINGVQILPNVPYQMSVGSSFYIGSPKNTFIITE